MKHLFAPCLIALALLGLPLGSAAADEDDGPFFVQILSFMVNAEDNGKRAGQVPTTPYLKTATKDDAETICKKFSHVREAVVSTAFNSTIQIQNGQPVYNDMEAEMLRAVNRALRKKLVSSLTLMYGAHPMGQGVSSKLPYNSMGCRTLTQLPTLEEIRQKRMGR